MVLIAPYHVGTPRERHIKEKPRQSAARERETEKKKKLVNYYTEALSRINNPTVVDRRISRVRAR